MGEPTDPLPRVARAYLIAAARARGTVFHKRSGRNITRGPYGDCWTNAWRLAEAANLRYAEGIVTTPDGKTTAHAWCIDKHGAVVEPTTGYENAVEYRGFILPKGFVRGATARWKGWRSSVLECLMRTRKFEQLTRQR